MQEEEGSVSLNNPGGLCSPSASPVLATSFTSGIGNQKSASGWCSLKIDLRTVKTIIDPDSQD